MEIYLLNSCFTPAAAAAFNAILTCLSKVNTSGSVLKGGLQGCVAWLLTGWLFSLSLFGLALVLLFQEGISVPTALNGFCIATASSWFLEAPFNPLTVGLFYRQQQKELLAFSSSAQN
jgi:hypothetical protein